VRAYLGTINASARNRPQPRYLSRTTPQNQSSQTHLCSRCNPRHAIRGDRRPQRYFGLDRAVVHAHLHTLRGYRVSIRHLSQERPLKEGFRLGIGSCSQLPSAPNQISRRPPQECGPNISPRQRLLTFGSLFPATTSLSRTILDTNEQSHIV
jgi:hypothetical protein